MGHEREEVEVTSSGRPPPEVEIYPWHARLWERLTREPARLPHGLLMQGRGGVGKRALALRLAQWLLCEQAGVGDAACGLCGGCHLFRAGTHPDLMAVEPLEGSRQITIDQVRAVGEFLALKPHRAEHKIVILSPAQAMNANAANSLLKTLEEPPLGSLLLLVTDQPQRLPATVRSRCTRLTVDGPSRAEARAWLNAAPRHLADAGFLFAYAGGGPLRAVALAAAGFAEKRHEFAADLEALAAGHDDPLAVAQRWRTAGAEMALSWLYGFVADLIRLAHTRGSATELANSDMQLRLNGLRERIQLIQLHDFLGVISETRNLLGGPLDEQLLLEELTIRWSRLAQGNRLQ